MRNTIAWSHDLLLLEEQTLFRRLSVFSGGCTIPSAEAVGTREGPLDVFGGLTSLVDKNLLRQEEGTEGEPRFRMLETVREYGQERLEASGEGEDTRCRLADWCLSLAEQAQPDVPGRTVPPHWVARLNEELANLRTAVTWLLDHGEASRALRLLAATEDYWTQQHTSSVELRQWLETALAAAPQAPATDRALAHWLLTLMNGVRGQGEAAGVHAQQALIAAQSSGEPHLLGVAQYAVGLAWDFRGDFARAAAAYAEAIPLLRAAGSETFVWFAQAILADKLVLSGDLDKGVPMLDEALMHLQETSADWFVVLAIDHRGHVALLQRDLSGAARWFTETIDLARRLKQTRALLSAVTGLAGVVLELGGADRAVRLLGAVEAAREALGLGQIHNTHHTDRILADSHAALESPRYEQCWAVGRLLSLEEAVGEALAVANDIPKGGE
jgi:non-specific serine/threonine protein kinase